MTPEMWRTINRIFHAARELPASQADQFVYAECGNDHQMYSEVRRMLLADSETSPLDDAPLHSPPSVFSPGQILAGRYRIVRFLNRGGMGEVYEAEDLELKERVALKTLLPEIACDSRMLARFKQEIQLSRRIGHPNVCRVFDIERHISANSPGESVVFLSMEFLDGETLSARIHREGRLSEAFTLELLEQMAAALDAAHRTGVIHRDFKPSNVMLVPNGTDIRAVVTDFGLARSFISDEATQTFTGHVMGTPDYMAPELFNNVPASVASDMYALGVSAWKMVSGSLPARSAPGAGRPVPSIRAQIPDIDPNWDKALICALDPDPQQRFSSAAELVAAIRGEVVLKPVPRLPVTRRSAVLLAVLLAVSIPGWFGWKRWSDFRGQPSPEAAAYYRTGLDDIHGGAYYAATKALSEAVRIAPNFSLAHARLADAWLELDASEKAGREMLLARRESGSRLSELDRLQLEAVDLTVTREFKGAVGKYERMHSLVPADSDIDLDLGRAWEKEGQVSNATAAYLRAARSPKHNPAAWLRLAVLYSRASDSAKAQQAFKQAEELYQATSNLEGLTETDQQRGIAANARSQLDEARTALLRALETARLAGNVQQEISVKLRLSSNAYLSGDTPLAERYASEALEGARQNQMEVLANRGIVNLGNAYFRKGDFAGAEKYYQESLSLARRNNSQRLAALSLLSLAGLHDQMKRSDDSAREAQEALDYYRPNSFARETLQCLTLLGRAQMNRADYTEALKTFEEALATAENSQDRFQTALANESMGRVLMELERYPEALPHLQKDLEMSTDAEHAGYAAINCGAALWRLGRYAEAAAMFAGAEPKAEKFVPMQMGLALTRAEMALSQDRYQESSNLGRRVIASSPGAVKVAEATVVLCLSQIRSTSPREGLRNCESAVPMAAGLEDAPLLLSARLALAEARLQNGDRAGTVPLIRQVEPLVTDLPHTRLLVLALAARAEPERAPELRTAMHRQLDEIASQLGSPAFQTFSGRHDLRDMLRPLDLAFSATSLRKQ
jgi:tetratricopeptide (TPR) repeat protein